MSSVMKNKDFDIVDFDDFVSLFMRDKDDSFKYIKRPIQVYPLSIASKYIKTPTPLFRAKYNFILFFQEGGGKQQVDNEIYELNANDVLFIREGHLNAIKSITSSTVGYFLYVDSTHLHQIFGNSILLNRLTFNPKHSISPKDMEWLCNCCELIMGSGKNNDLKFEEISVSLMSAVVQKLAQFWPKSFSTTNRQSEITMLFKELLYDNFLTNREVGFYAQELTISENYLTRCVKTVTQRSPKQHINEMVIFYSKILLQDFSKDIAQVAFELNFLDPSYFGRLFKELTNQSPSEFRTDLKQDLSEY
ncbi:transcriptional regulator, AraC family [Haliscomenobacter hydrossis DSM 1100]|uniref:Transcriptional regulator, AraC family n=2 Tax=Haliscomenobacter TaxID=2349 RepID=F4L0F0_HALH1|nr:transcriptional regulator, AraC family [Haliscomenobacter hydrossis DSM 1100]